MGWGELPSDVRAAEEARRQALEQAEEADQRRARRPMSAFESKLIGVLEQIRDNTNPAGPSTALTAALGAGLDPLLDSEPAVLARSVQAGGLALANAFPTFRDDLTAAGFQKFAEVAIEAALHEAARDRNAEADLMVDAAQRRGSDEAGAGDAGPAPATP